MKAFLNILTSLLILGLICACDKGPELTPITQDGRNTFSCKVNGKVWVAERTPDLFAPKEAIYGGFLRVGPDTLSIYIRAFKPDRTSLKLYLRSTNVGTHELRMEAKPYSIYPQSHGSYESSEGKLFTTNTNAVGWVKLSKTDAKAGLLAGTFEFTATTSSGETVEITSGRFDLNTNTLDP
jgi:hypothetical protein